ncbi:MAG TPA: KilA-N domain-containing protein [Bacteroidales bacterium]|nr:KilA-N domain-containing protein [Bacteroidales bacterium]
MNKPKQKATLNADGKEIALLHFGDENDYISLTDIARVKNTDDAFIVINNWMRSKDTILFLGLWEQLNNPDFKPIEFDRFKNEAGANAFTLSPQKWISSTNAVGIISKSGRYGGTYAHKDIAFEFASWVSAEFKLYLIKDYQRLKNDENSRLSLSWNLGRELVKINYHIHTDAIKANLIPEDISNRLSGIIYANEADILNVALFGKTAREWRDENPEIKGNLRDFATYQQLIVLVNLESMNAELIKLGLSQNERVLRLNKMAIEQMTALARYRKQAKEIENK